MICLAFACGTALAQVYQSTDADGNTVFSDQPTPDSIEVDVDPPNVADPLATPVPPSAAPVATESRPAPPKQAENVEKIYIEDDDDDGRIVRPGKRWRRVGPRHPRPNR